MNYLDQEYLRWGKNNDKNPTKKLIPLKFHYNPYFMAEKDKGAKILVDRDGSIKNGSLVCYKQKVTIKASYTRYGSKSKVTSNTESSVAYAFKYDGIVGYGSKKGEIDEKTAQEMMKGKKVFKIIISPEDASLAGEDFTRKVICTLENMLGRKLVWFAVEHRDTDHPHTHVVISREDGEGLSFDTPLYISPKIIKTELREKAEELATRIRGYVYPNELLKKMLENIDVVGFTSLDAIIEKQTTLNGFLSLDALGKIQQEKRVLVRKRLEKLSKMDIGIIKVKSGYIIGENWKSKLFDASKIRKVDPSFNVGSDKITLFSSSKGQRTVITGKIIKKSVIDELNDRVGFIVESDDGRQFYHEQVLDYAHYSKLNVGSRVKLSWKSLTNRHNKAYDVPRIDTEEYGL